MSTKERGNKALRAMKALGIAGEKAKPVLRRLLQLFNKNWELIEEENYRALIDAIFESEDAQVTEEASPVMTGNYDEAGGSMNTANGQAEHLRMKIIRAHNEDETEEEQETEALARPLKRLRHKHQDGQSSSPLIKPKDEPNELPEVNNRSQEPVSSKTLRGQGGSNSKPTDANRNEQNMSPETQSPTHPTTSVTPNVPSKRKRPLNESSSHASHPEGPRAELDIVLSAKKKSSVTTLIKIKDEPVTDDVPPLEAPLAVFRPEQSNGGGSSSWNGTIRGDSHLEPSRQSAKELETNGQRNNGKPVTIIDENASAIEVASSPLRDVKILISCNAALQRPGFQVPSLQAVLKAVEDKCLKSYKILDPNFSVMNIMKEMCQSFLELGSKSNTEQPKTLDVTRAIDLMNKLSANCNSNVEVPLPDSPPIPLHRYGSKDGAQPNRINGGDPIGTDGEETENAGQTNNMSLVVAQQADMVTSIHVDDVAKGYEKVVIPLVNEVDDSLPPSFYYLSQSAVFKSANVNFTLSCIGDSLCITCSRDCCSSITSCGCAVESEFWYTKDGYVKEEILNECISMKRDPKKHVKFFCVECPLEKPIHVDGAESCKGHLIKKFIKECWIKCGCHRQCGNRVVQRGITRKLQVFMTSEGKGWGLRTLEDIPKGAFVCEYVGEILTLAEFMHSSRTEKGSCPVLLDANWSGEEEQKEENALCLDGTDYGNVARFINHRCYDSNLVEIPVQVEIPEHHYYHVAFFTTREVKAMEELTWEYGIDFEDNHHLLKPFNCLCGSTFCRNSKAY